MHRRSLTLRRFGALSFGLGYFEDGVWIDHSVDGDASSADDASAPRAAGDRIDPDAVHQWYSCCGSEADGHPTDLQVATADVAPMLRVAGRSVQ